MKYALLLTMSVFALANPAAAQERCPILNFFAADPEHSALADSARAIWEATGPRILEAMEAASGLRFQDSTITIIMRAAPASSGAAGSPLSPLRLDIRYPIPMSLIHELGHRLNQQLATLPDDLNTGHRGLASHKLLYLYLYDVWVQLYGAETADQWRETERDWANLGFAFIRDAWDWSMSLGTAGRAAKLRDILAANQ